MTEAILLTGGAGYIGSHTYLALAEAGYRPVVLDDFSNAHKRVIERLAGASGRAVPCEELSVLDVQGVTRVLKEHRITAVIHFAAKKVSAESFEKPVDYMETNVCGLVALLRAMAAAEVFTLVFSSTAAVYGEPEKLPIPETARCRPASPYGFTKLTGERLLEQLRASDPRWRLGVLRYFNPVGAHPSGLIGDDPASRPANILPYIQKVATGELPEIVVFGDDYETPDGTGVRDYIHVSDIAEGHVLSLNALLETGRSHLVNLGTGRGFSVLELIRAYSAECGRDLPFRIEGRRPGDVAASYADVTRAGELLGFQARRGLEEMCRSSWAWVRKRTETGS